MGYRIKTVFNKTKMTSKGYDELIQPLLDEGAGQGWKMVFVTQTGPSCSLYWETPD